MKNKKKGTNQFFMDNVYHILMITNCIFTWEGSCTFLLRKNLFYVRKIMQIVMIINLILFYIGGLANSDDNKLDLVFHRRPCKF